MSRSLYIYGLFCGLFLAGHSLAAHTASLPGVLGKISSCASRIREVYIAKGSFGLGDIFLAPRLGEGRFLVLGNDGDSYYAMPLQASVSDPQIQGKKYQIKRLVPFTLSELRNPFGNGLEILKVGFARFRVLGLSINPNRDDELDRAYIEVEEGLVYDSRPAMEAIIAQNTKVGDIVQLRSGMFPAYRVEKISVQGGIVARRLIGYQSDNLSFNPRGRVIKLVPGQWVYPIGFMDGQGIAFAGDLKPGQVVLLSPHASFYVVEEVVFDQELSGSVAQVRRLVGDGPLETLRYNPDGRIRALNPRKRVFIVGSIDIDTQPEFNPVPRNPR